MTVVRTHRYLVDPADFAELCARRAELIAKVRAVHPGLTRTVLVRVADNTYTDSWYWESAERKQTAGPVVRGLPEAAAALGLVRDRTDEDGDVLDER